MKIVLFDFVFDQKRPGISGLSDIVWNWAKHLVLCGEEVHIVAPYPTATQPPQGVIPHRFPLPPIGYRNIVGHILIVLRGWQEIRAIGKIDVVQAPEYLSTAVFSLLSRTTPVILRVPGNIFERLERGNPFDWSTTQVLKMAARLSARCCARIIVTSEEMRSWWQRTGAPASKIVLIPNGVDTDQFRHIPNAKVTLRIDAAKPVVLYVGRLSREKGIETLFEAVNLASEDIPSIELHLVGDGPLRQQLAQVARHYRMEHRTVFHGWVDQPNLPVYYSAADVTVMPSLSEPFGRVAVEAMACGSPMICTTVSGAADHIHEGETGFVVPPGDASELAVKLKRILQDSNLASRVGRQGREYVQRELSWEAVVRSMRLEVYQVLVPGQRT